MKHAQDIPEKVKDVLAEHLEMAREKFTPEASFANDLQIDEGVMPGVYIAIEQEFDESISDETQEAIQTVGDLIAALEQIRDS